MSHLLPQAGGRAGGQGHATPEFADIAHPDPDPVLIATTARRLTGKDPTQAEIRLIAKLWDLARPLEALLIAGGDDRLTLDPATGRNRYLCPPYPEPDAIALGSCTASAPSPLAYEAAETARQALFADAVLRGNDLALRTASAGAAEAVAAHFQASDLAEIILAASGTDAALLLTGLLAAGARGRPIGTILMSPSETGSGVPQAVQGQHFAPCTASGAQVCKGGPVAGFPPALVLTTIALRDADGLPRDAAALATQAETAIGDIVAAGGRAVLHAIDGSKTGLMGPDRATCQRLAARFGTDLDVVIDACQARLEPELIRSYLQQGFPVLVTGSKFFAAPGFCGAILFPRSRLARIGSGADLPAGLAAYADIDAAGMTRRCAGLVLRWTAALAEMQRFAAMPVAAIRHALDAWGTQTRAAIMSDSRLRLIQAPRPAGAGWSDRPSIFTFAVRSAAGWMSAADLRPLFQALAQRLHHDNTHAHVLSRCCRIGQPVELAPGLGGLRIAFSAAQLGGQAELKGDISAVFGKLSLLLDNGSLISQDR